MPRKSILIYADDDFEKMSDLRREVMIAENAVEQARRSPLLIGDEEPSSEAVDAARSAFDNFVDEAAERADEWVIETIGHAEFRDLMAKHPPRQVPVEGEEGKTKVHQDDDGFNVDTSTFGKALLLFRQVDEDGDESRTIVEPDLPQDQIRRRIKRLSLGQFDTLWAAAYVLNSNGISDPRAGKFSTTRSSNET